jgi:hypothetical protein
VLFIVYTKKEVILQENSYEDIFILYFEFDF